MLRSIENSVSSNSIRVGSARVPISRYAVAPISSSSFSGTDGNGNPFLLSYTKGERIWKWKSFDLLLLPLLFLLFLLLREGESSEADVRARVQPRAGNRIEHGQRIKSSGT